jgi:hypothetical protein
LAPGFETGSLGAAGEDDETGAGIFQFEKSEVELFRPVDTLEITVLRSDQRVNPF